MALTDAQFKELSFAGKGCTYVSGTTPQKGHWCAIIPVEDTVIASITAQDLGGDSPAGMPLPTGIPFYGDISAFTLTSGKVLAYKR